MASGGGGGQVRLSQPQDPLLAPRRPASRASRAAVLAHLTAMLRVRCSTRSRGRSACGATSGGACRCCSSRATASTAPTARARRMPWSAAKRHVPEPFARASVPGWLLGAGSCSCPGAPRAHPPPARRAPHSAVRVIPARTWVDGGDCAGCCGRGCSKAAGVDRADVRVQRTAWSYCAARRGISGGTGSCRRPGRPQASSAAPESRATPQGRHHGQCRDCARASDTAASSTVCAGCWARRHSARARRRAPDLQRRGRREGWQRWGPSWSQWRGRWR